MQMNKLYCPVKGSSCLEKECALYYEKDSKCAIIKACEIFDNFQKVLQDQATSHLEMIDLLSMVNTQADSVNMES
jgi:hypothetical protein